MTKYGVEIEIEAQEWMERSFGEFLQLTASIISLRLSKSSIADKVARLIIPHHQVIDRLQRIELPGCHVSDAAVLELRCFPMLEHIDLSYTPISRKAVAIVDALPFLRTLSLQGASMGWFTRLRVRSKLAQKKRHLPARLKT